MDWKPAQDDEFRKNYQELKQLIDSTLKKVRQTENLREAKGMLIEVQNAFKGLRLERNDRTELYDRLQEAFGEINTKISSERNRFEQEALSNYSGIKLRIDEAVFLVNNSHDFHESWNFLLEVQSEFKEAKLLREHRDELYPRLQHAFDTLKQNRHSERTSMVAESGQTYQELRVSVDRLVASAPEHPDTRAFKDDLIALQRTIKETKLTKEHRDDLLNLLQEAFLIIQIRQDEEFQHIREEAGENVKRLLPLVHEMLEVVTVSEDFHETRERLKLLQAEIRNSRLMKEQREELNKHLQEAFDILSTRQTAKQEVFTRESSLNYDNLKSLVEKGFKQAEESTKYKETREFLKKIQGEFKGIKLTGEQRDTLYARLQTAFSILNRRVDEFFREKKKNWMLKMQYKFSESSSEVFLLEKNIQKEQLYLKELEDQLEIVVFAGKEKEVIAGLKSRIDSTKKSIERQYGEIRELEAKIDELHNLLEPPEASS